MDKKNLLAQTKGIMENMISNLEGLKPLKLSSLNPCNTMAISVDINNGFAKRGALYSDRTEKLIPETVNLFKKMNNLEIVLLAYTDTHTENSPELSSYPNHCMVGSNEEEVIDELKEIKGLTIRPKNSTNGFFAYNPLLESTFDNIEQEYLDNIDTFVVTGVCIDICINQFALALKTYLNEHNRKSRVIIPANLVDTFDAPNHNADFLKVVFLQSLMDNGIEVVSEII